MSPASHWFSKRIHPPNTKSLPSDHFDRSAPADKLSLHSKNSDSFRFSNFASVMGRKSKLKKPRPTLAIPDCPVPPLVSPSSPVHSSGHPSYANRPPANSISSTIRSGDDSLEPRTPLDVYRDRVSLPLSVLTLSDPDPFAAGAISVPKSILDRGRTSVCSSTSANNIFPEVDLCQPPPFASTFLHSHNGDGGIPSSDSSGSPLSSDADSRTPWSREMSTESEMEDERKSQGSSVKSNYSNTKPKASLSKYGSLSTLTGPPDSPAAAVRPTVRTRCHTEASSSRASIISRPSKRSTSPSSEIFFHSGTLNHQQPFVSPKLMDSDAQFPSSAVHTSSSSSISFTSNRMIQDPLTEDIIDPRYQSCKEINSGPDFGTLRQSVNEFSSIHARGIPESSLAPPAFHRIKKSMSHSTLQKAKLDPSNRDAFHDTCRGHKEVKRQHSFHQSRRNTPTPMPAPTTMPLHHESSNQCRKPPLSHPQAVVRKRLFSGSNRRPSTPIADEDMRSVFSLPTEAEHYVESTRAVASMLDEPSSDSLAPGMVQPGKEFTPQHIMSPAEMLKVEAIVQDEFDAKYGEAIRNRQRGISSPSTPMYSTTYMKEGVNTASTPFLRLASTRNVLVTSRGPTATSSLRPSSAQTASSSASMSSSSSTASPRLGLPHPPRLRTRPRTAETICGEDLFNRRTSNVPFIPLSPPPRLKRPNRTSSIMSEKVAPQRSVMRKPSFLEIVDDISSYDGSFLEFDSGKESLDFS